MAMIANGASAFVADLAAASLEAKPAQLQQRSMSRHSTATSLPESLLGRLAEDMDFDSDCDFEGGAEWDLDDGSIHDEGEFEDRSRFEYQFDDDMEYRPDLYADAFEVADGDLVLYGWDIEELPEEDADALEFDELETEAKDEVQPVEAAMSADPSEKSANVDAAPLAVPKAPPSTAPRGFARKHKDVLVVSIPAEKASETPAPRHERTKVPQGSALAAIAALRPGLKSGSGSDSAAQARPLVPVAPAGKPSKTRPCSRATLCS